MADTTTPPHAVIPLTHESILVYQVAACLCLAWLGLVLLLEAVSFFKEVVPHYMNGRLCQMLWGDRDLLPVTHRNSPSKLTPVIPQNRQMRAFLLANTCFSLITLTLVSVLAFSPSHALSPFTCDILGRIMPATYAMGVQFAYLFMLKKAKLVAMFPKGVWYKHIAYFSWLGVVVFIPFVMMPLALAFFGGVVLEPSGICMQVATQTWLPVFFAVGNLVFAGCMMYLFVIPMWYHSSELRARGTTLVESNKVARVARNNVKYTSVALASTVAATTMMSVAYAMSEAHHEQGNLLLLIAFMGIFIDIVINNVMLHLMTNVWIHAAVKDKLACCYDVQAMSEMTHASSGQGASSKSPSLILSRNLSSATVAEKASPKVHNAPGSNALNHASESGAPPPTASPEADARRLNELSSSDSTVGDLA